MTAGQWLDLFLILNTLGLILTAIFLWGSGVVLHIDIKKYDRNGLSHALRDLLYVSALFVALTAGLAVGAVFNSITLYREAVIVILAARLLTFVLIGKAAANLIIKMMVAEREGECID